MMMFCLLKGVLEPLWVFPLNAQGLCYFLYEMEKRGSGPALQKDLS